MGDLSLQRLSPTSWPQPLSVSPAGQVWESQHARTPCDLAVPPAVPKPFPPPSLTPAALALLLVLRLQHKPLTLSSPRLATQRTPSLLPGQIHSLSDLSTSLFYSSLSASSLSNDSLIYSALHGQQSFAAHQTPRVITSAGRAGVGSPILGRRKGPQVPSPYLSWSPFFSRGKRVKPIPPPIFSPSTLGEFQKAG